LATNGDFTYGLKKFRAPMYKGVSRKISREGGNGKNKAEK